MFHGILLAKAKVSFIFINALLHTCMREIVDVNSAVFSKSISLQTVHHSLFLNNTKLQKCIIKVFCTLTGLINILRLQRIKVLLHVHDSELELQKRIDSFFKF